MNYLNRFKLTPFKPKNFKQLASILILALSLPLFIWGIVTLNFNYKRRAATGEPGVCMAQNKVITVTPPGGQGTCHDIQTAINSVTGSGYTVQIVPGYYPIYSTINVNSKDTINITGFPQSGSSAAQIVFNNSNGWGFKVSNSTGTIQWLTITGNTPNGLLSIEYSNGFTISQSRLQANSSHTMDVKNSNHINVYNTEIHSMAGALEIFDTKGIVIANNRILNSDNAITFDNTEYVQMFGNLIHNNRESAIKVRNNFNFSANHNTIYKNGSKGVNFPAVKVEGMITGQIDIHDNIVAFNNGAGLQFSGTASNLAGVYRNNDVYGNYSNYEGVADQTGVNGNISADPLFNLSTGTFCLMPGSPALYGRNNYMGHIGLCRRNPSPSPSSSPSASPSPTASPEPKLGDINNDGLVNIVDIGIIIDNYRIVPPPNPRADLNSDGISNIVDIGIVIDNYGI